MPGAVPFSGWGSMNEDSSARGWIEEDGGELTEALLEWRRKVSPLWDRPMAPVITGTATWHYQTHVNIGQGALIVLTSLLVHCWRDGSIGMLEQIIVKNNDKKT